mmetsp:Transcript_24617/g.38375  ORF Transcript_24617/g.38375 Transcript_24617/m.38375 type:complete len:84 (+) Transcript_24617:78-329(+)
MAQTPFGKSLVAFAGAIVGGLVGFRVQHILIERERDKIQKMYEEAQEVKEDQETSSVSPASPSSTPFFPESPPSPENQKQEGT